MTNLLSDLAINIKKHRLDRGFTQDELSDRAGIAYSTVAKLEQGAIKNPTLTTMVALADVLKISVSDLTKPAQQKDTPKSSTVKQVPKFIYFDLNDVIIDFIGRVFTLVSHESSVPVDKVEMLFEHYNAVAIKGSMNIDDFNRQLGDDLGLDGLNWLDYYVKGVEPDQGVLETIDKLKGKIPIGVLTNTLPGAVSRLKQAGYLPDRKDIVIIDSSEVKSAKPEQKIYEIAEEKAGLKGKDILFIDDLRGNLQSAEKRGWQTIWFNRYDRLASLKKINNRLGL